MCSILIGVPRTCIFNARTATIIINNTDNDDDNSDNDRKLFFAKAGLEYCNLSYSIVQKLYPRTYGKLIE